MNDSMPWQNSSIPDGYRIDDEGVWTSNNEKISGPIWIDAFTKNPDTDEYGIYICWIDLDENQISRVFSRDVIYEDGNKFIQFLGRNGLAIAPNKKGKLKEYLSSCRPDKRYKAVNHGGWISSVTDELCYVLPNEEGLIETENGDLIAFQPEQHSPTVRTLYPKGTLEDWIHNIAKPCSGNPFLVAALCVPFAAPLLRPAKLESGAIHIYGKSSQGKTTAAQVAASVFGCGADPSHSPDTSFVQRWNTTLNGLEGLFAACNDIPLIIDEIHQCDSKDFGKIIYNLSGGCGKNAMDKDRNLKQRRGWRTLVFSTGNKSGAQMVEDDNKKINEAQSSRFLDILAGENIIIDTHGAKVQDYVEDLKRGAGTFFGVAGPKFINSLIDKFKNSYALEAVIQRRLADEEQIILGDKYFEPHQQRGLKRLALVMLAGKLASEFEILPFTNNEIESSVMTLVRAWISDKENQPDRVKGVHQLIEYMHKNESYFHFSSSDQTKYKVLGYKHYIGNGEKPTYLFTPDMFKTACGGYDIQEVANEIKKLGCLTHDSGRFTKKFTVDGIGRSWFYAVNSRLLSYDFDKNVLIND